MSDTVAVADQRPGRPRDTALVYILLSSTLELLLERDKREVTFPAITERSGVSLTALYRRWSSREVLIAEALESVQSSVDFRRRDATLETILASYEEAAIDAQGRVGALVKKRVAVGLENDELRALSWSRHVPSRLEPIAA